MSGRRKLWEEACDTCASRSVDCDRQSPACGTCAQLGLPCSGSKSYDEAFPNLRGKLDKISQYLEFVVQTHERLGRFSKRRMAMPTRAPDLDLYGGADPSKVMGFFFVEALFDGASLDTIGCATMDPEFRAKFEQARHQFYVRFWADFEELKPLVWGPERLDEGELEKGVDAFWNSDHGVGSYAITKLSVTRKELEGPELHPIARDIFLAGMFMFVNRQVGVGARKIQIALAQVLRAVSLSALIPPRNDIFRAYAFVLPMVSTRCAMPIVNFVSSIGYTAGTRLRLNSSATYVRMAPEHKLRMQASWWIFMGWCTVRSVLFGNYPIFRGTETDFPVPVWPPAAELENFHYLSRVTEFYEKNYANLCVMSTASSITAPLLSLAFELDSGLERGYETVASSLHEVVYRPVEFYGMSASMSYNVLKLMIWSRVAFLSLDADAAEICGIAARNLLKYSLMTTQTTNGSTALSVHGSILAFEALLLLAVLFPHHESLEVDLALVEEMMDQLLATGPPHITVGLRAGWDLIREKMVWVVQSNRQALAC